MQLKNTNHDYFIPGNSFIRKKIVMYKSPIASNQLFSTLFMRRHLLFRLFNQRVVIVVKHQLIVYKVIKAESQLDLTINLPYKNDVFLFQKWLLHVKIKTILIYNKLFVSSRILKDNWNNKIQNILCVIYVGSCGEQS